MSSKLSFDTLPNFRDVAVSINEFTGKTVLQPGKLYRAARPDDASLTDRKKLIEVYGVKHIMDLRTESEHVLQARKRDAWIRSSAAVPQSNDEAAEPLKIPGIRYHEINFNGNAYAWSLVRQLSWMQFKQFIGLMAMGRREAAISVLGVNVMLKRGLVGLAIDSLDVCTKEVKQVFDVLADEGNYPILVHCTQGKDRTGLVVLLVLLLLNVPEEAIDRDYMLSEKELLVEKESRMEEIRRIGLTEEFAGCPPDCIKRVSEHITSRYGSVSEYLLLAGVTEEMQQKVARILSG
ncbi:hypothetical protein FRB94_006413 [Tulasnella sp. JGI-2019a]|nr:hypothetical protein FRB94_006413 [Tulasnella sp. JGI-2019a]